MASPSAIRQRRRHAPRPGGPWLLRPAALRELIDASAGRRGCANLAELLAAGEAPVASRSELERRFLALCRAAGLPLPRCEVPIG